MRVIRNCLSDKQIKHIKDNYKFGDSDSYMKKNHSYDIDKIIHYYEIYYCDKNNPYILNSISSVLEPNEIVYSIHYINYLVGNSCDKHTDRASLNTYIFMLNDDFEGGKLLIDDIDTNLLKGDVVCFNGSIESHEVTEVTKGNREVLVVWTSDRRNSSLI